MIKLENYEVVGWEHAIRGMRNPKNSWHLMDSKFDRDPDYGCSGNCPCEDIAGNCECCCIGPNDKKLMKQLAKGGPVHAKYRRMIVVYVDITAPLYWWKEFDTYKVGTVANSCSTMHKIHAKEFTLDDFSYGQLFSYLSEDETAPASNIKYSIPSVDLSPDLDGSHIFSPYGILNSVIIPMLNICRDMYLETGDKKYWWQMIQLLPTSYNQKRTVMLSYEVLANMHHWRKKIPHKLDEWLEFGAWIESLPYSEIITGEEEKTND